MAPTTAPAAETDDEFDTKDRLLEVTTSILKEQGDHALRVVDIAEASDVAVSTIYAHFSDRTDLVAQARAEQYRAHSDEATAQVDAVMDPALDADEYAEVVNWPGLYDPDHDESRERRWDRLEAVADSRHIPKLASDLAEGQREVQDRIEQMIERGQELGTLDPELDPKAIAMFSQVMRFGLVLWDVDEESRPETEAWETLMQRICQSLLAPEA